jgi:hypothetical protein
MSKILLTEPDELYVIGNNKLEAEKNALFS